MNEKNEKRVWFNANHYCVDEDNDPGDGGPWSGYHRRWMQVDFDYAYLEKPPGEQNFWLDSTVLHGDDSVGNSVYLVVALFSHGCTFSNVHGEYDVKAAFGTYDEAATFAQVNYDKYRKQHDDYFGGLDSVEVRGVPLKG